MRVIKTVAGMKKASGAALGRGDMIGLVPTMGCLHEGHLSLVRKAKARCGTVVVSIFVNPTQFARGEDLESYPKDTGGDLAKCRDEGVDTVFMPDVLQMYPGRPFGVPGSYIVLPGVSETLCGASRPGHFSGVATVVAKLFNIVRPHMAFFGLKDYQQTVVIKKMVKDLDMDVKVVTVPTVREPDGLAMSSRNKYLSPAERPAAARLYAALASAAQVRKNGETTARALVDEVMRVLAGEPLIRPEYVSVVDPEDLSELATVGDRAVIAAAVRVGKARLIDNVIV